MENKFKRVETPISGLVIIEPTVYGDDRGFFLESYSKESFHQLGIHVEFVQDNHSRSCANVLRGIHFQVKHPQGKLVRVVRGSAFDVAVDLRRGSVTFGQWFGVELSETNKKLFYIPAGFGHGFLSLEDDTEFTYKATDYYQPTDESGIIYNDADLEINWPTTKGTLIMSKKDLSLGSFALYKENAE